MEKKKYGGQNFDTVFVVKNTALVKLSIWKTNLQIRLGISEDTERQLI